MPIYGAWTLFNESDILKVSNKASLQIGDKYVCTYGCPVNEQGYGICSKMMQLLYGDMQAVRSGGDLTLVGGTEPFVKDYVCPDGCVCFQMRAVKTENENFYKGKFYQES